MMDDATRYLDVIIVGGGPIGLTTGCALRHHGVECLILEQRAEPKPYSRANNLWARPQELLASVGLRDALAAQAYTVGRINSVFFGKPDAPIAVDEAGSPFPSVLYSGQDVIEKTLTDTFVERGGTLRRGTRVLDITEVDGGVRVSVTDDPDSEVADEILHCRYLIGADGNEGGVRKAIAADFATEAFEGRMNRQVDARLTWRRPTDPDQLWFFYYETGFCGIMPVWGGYHRLFFLQSDEGVPDRDPTLEEIQHLAREVTGDDSVTLSDPIWSTHSRFKHGVAPHYAKGRVFLVGDAGHFTLPIGGQGMNAGFHDAVEIAWRLAMQFNGAAGDAVLASYDGERQGEHSRLDKQQARAFRQLMYRGRVADVAMEAASRIVPNLGSLIQGTNDLQQIDVSYPDSLLNAEHMGVLDRLLHRGEPRAGDRAPDANVRQPDGTTGKLFDYIYNPDGLSWGWSLFAFDGGSADLPASLGDTFARLSTWSFVKPRLVLSNPQGQAVAGVTSLFDLDSHAHRAFRLEGRPALVVIRPDGHIAFRAPLDRQDLLDAFCTATFTAPGR